MKSLRKYILLACSLMVGCTDLDLEPKSTTTDNVVFSDPAAYRAFLAKLYAGLSTTGQQGPAGDQDVQNVDEGASSYLRQLFNAQELTTEMAVIAWGDATLAAFHDHSWTAQNEFVTALYNRIYFQIGMCNEFLRQTTDQQIDGLPDQLKSDIRQYRAEARFLRALSYWHGVDMFANIPLITEEDKVGKVAFPQATRAAVYNFIVKELTDIEAGLVQPGKGQYGRADQGAAWMLLAKVYLNAMQYIGEDRNNDCVTICNKIISSGAYQLENVYHHLFLADNHRSKEIIFSIPFDGNNIRTWGGITYFLNAAIGGSMNPRDYGLADGWWGLRTTSALVDLFPDETGAIDSRAFFYTQGQQKEINAITNFTDGYAVIKYQNITSDGTPGVHGNFPDTDFPMFRLGDVHLMYAEAVARGATNGSRATAVALVNDVRRRAYGNENGDISDAELTLAFLKDERARELYWECHRRTDLIRFNAFTHAGVWPWKGGVKEGRLTEAYRDIFPIPAAERIANPKLEQNFGY